MEAVVAVEKSMEETGCSRGDGSPGTVRHSSPMVLLSVFVDPSPPNRHAQAHTQTGNPTDTTPHHTTHTHTHEHDLFIY